MSGYIAQGLLEFKFDHVEWQCYEGEDWRQCIVAARRSRALDTVDCAYASLEYTVLYELMVPHVQEIALLG